MTVSTDPRPGDLMVALKPMGAWRDEFSRKPFAFTVDPGDTVTVVNAWRSGRQVKARVLFGGQIAIFSCASKNMHRNWQLIASERAHVDQRSLGEVPELALEQDQNVVAITL